jgi:hypothetical protein
MKKHLLILPRTLLWGAAPAADVIVVSSQPTPDNSQSIAVTTTPAVCWMAWSPGFSQIQLNILNCENQQGTNITGTMEVIPGCAMPSETDSIRIPTGEKKLLFTLGNACSTPSTSPLASWCASIPSQHLARSADYTTLPGGQGKCTITLA